MLFCGFKKGDFSDNSHTVLFNLFYAFGSCFGTLAIILLSFFSLSKIRLEHSIRTTPPLNRKSNPERTGWFTPLEVQEGIKKVHRPRDCCHLKSAHKTQERCISLNGPGTYPGKYALNSTQDLSHSLSAQGARQ